MTVSLPEPDSGPASASSTSSRSAFVEGLIEEMARRWQAGERPLAEDYLARHPELADQAAAAVELIYEEVCLRQEHGEEADAEQVLRRFPQWEQQLRILLDCHELLEGTGTPLCFPEGEKCWESSASWPS